MQRLRTCWRCLVNFAVSIILVIVAVALFAFALARPVSDNMTLILAVISGGFISAFFVVFSDALARWTLRKDALRALGNELALNIMWSGSNTVAFKEGLTLVWVRFRPDHILSILGQSSSLGISRETEDLLRRAADRMHSFNQNCDTYYLTHGHLTKSLTQTNEPTPTEGPAQPQSCADRSVGLVGAMHSATVQLYLYFFPFLVAQNDLAKYTSSAKRQYEEKDLWPNAALLKEYKIDHTAVINGDKTEQDGVIHALSQIKIHGSDSLKTMLNEKVYARNVLGMTRGG